MERSVKQIDHWATAWLTGSRAGVCAYRNSAFFVDGKIPNDCESGEQGQWPIDAAAVPGQKAAIERCRWQVEVLNTSALNAAPRGCLAVWTHAVQACGAKCLGCSRCTAVSVSLLHMECRWYARCSLEHLIDATNPLAYRTGWMRNPAYTCSAPSSPPPSASLPRPPRSSRSSSIDVWRLRAPDVRCDERYVSEVTCGGRRFLFSRRDVSPDRFPTSWEGRKNGWETMVRTVAPAPRVGGGSKWADAQSQAMELKLANLTYSKAESSLPVSLEMSHNAAFLCVDGHRLQVYGGQAYRGDRMRQGIMRREADARILPLSWSKPELIISGDPRISHCLEARCLDKYQNVLEDCSDADRPFTCEFDGKLAVARLNEKLYLFSRANHYDHGGRWVQVASQPQFNKGGPRGSRPFGRFRQIVLDGYIPERRNNIYFFTARRLPPRAGSSSSDGEQQLLGLFPAVLSEDRRQIPGDKPPRQDGGIWCSISSDGVNWERPTRVWESAVVTETRTRDWPVELAGGDDAENGDGNGHGPLRILVQHDVTIDEGGEDYWQRFCTRTMIQDTGGGGIRINAGRWGHMRVPANPPRICEYKFKLSEILADWPKAADGVESQGYNPCGAIAAALDQNERQRVREMKSRHPLVRAGMMNGPSPLPPAVLAKEPPVKVEMEVEMSANRMVRATVLRHAEKAAYRNVNNGGNGNGRSLIQQGGNGAACAALGASLNRCMRQNGGNLSCFELHNGDNKQAAFHPVRSELQELLLAAKSNDLPPALRMALRVPPVGRNYFAATSYLPSPKRWCELRSLRIAQEEHRALRESVRRRLCDGSLGTDTDEMNRMLNSNVMGGPLKFLVYTSESAANLAAKGYRQLAAKGTRWMYAKGASCGHGGGGDGEWTCYFKASLCQDGGAFVKESNGTGRRDPLVDLPESAFTTLLQWPNSIIRAMHVALTLEARLQIGLQPKTEERVKQLLRRQIVYRNGVPSPESIPAGRAAYLKPGLPPVIGMHVRRGDACETFNGYAKGSVTDLDAPRSCYPFEEYVTAARRLKTLYGGSNIVHLITDSAEVVKQLPNFPEFEWHLLEFGRERVSGGMANLGTTAPWQRTYIEKRAQAADPANSEIVHTALADLSFVSEAHMFVGTARSFVSKAALMMMWARMGVVPPAVSLEGDVLHTLLHTRGQFWKIKVPSRFGKNDHGWIPCVYALPQTDGRCFPCLKPPHGFAGASKTDRCMEESFVRAVYPRLDARQRRLDAAGGGECTDAKGGKCPTEAAEPIMR